MATKNEKTQAKRAPKATAKPPARPHTKPKEWALAAYVAVRGHVELMNGESIFANGAWDDTLAGAARILYMRAKGVDVRPADELERGHLPRPAGFTTWPRALEELEEVVVWNRANALRDGPVWCRGALRVSPYAVRIADDDTHPLHDARGAWKPQAEFVESLRMFGGNFDRIKLLPMREAGDEILYVDDGRQRVNGCRAANLLTVREWYRQALSSGTGEDAPKLIEDMPADILESSVKTAQAVAAASNNQRREDTTIILAERAGKLRAPTVGADGKEVPGFHQHEIASILGVSRQTVANLLILQDLESSLWVELRAGRLPITCAYLIAPLEHTRQLEIWKAVAGQPALGLREKILALIEGRELTTRVSKPRAVKDVESMRKRLDGLDGTGPMVARAVLDYVLGVAGPDVFRSFPDDLQQQFRMPTVGAEPEPAPTGLSRPGVRCRKCGQIVAWRKITTEGGATYVQADRHPDQNGEPCMGSGEGFGLGETVDLPTPKRGRRGQRDAPKPTSVDQPSKGWSVFTPEEQAGWESAGVSDEDDALTLGRCKITRDEAARMHTMADGRTSTFGALFSDGTLSGPQIKRLLQQIELPIAASPEGL